ncbi:ATP-binding protein [Empedobacter sp. UBA6745]|uniref:ATP-binding protein n=1 Tax=Empedobacter sp. UBA6745 TaxID=1946447 RepID=UPI0025C2509C|nr:ATP-binding protein [Empedobacter sp. UBA6745]
MSENNIQKIKAKSHILSLLGNELIGSDSLAIFELVKNSYDADADEVTVKFIDLNTPNQQIIIEDDGNGMTSKVISDVWLTIGTDFKRGKNRKVSPRYERVSFGNKGVGRLAVHKLAKSITLETQAIGEMFSSKLHIDWPKLISSNEYIQDLEVEVEHVSESLFKKGRGTRIILSDLTTKVWTKKTLKDLVRKINNIKNPFLDQESKNNIKNPFDIKIVANGIQKSWIEEVKSSVEILKESLYKFEFKIEKSSDIPNDFAKFRFRYEFNPPHQLKISSNLVESEVNEFHIGNIFSEFNQEKKFNHFLKNEDLEGIGDIKGKFYVFNQNGGILKKNFGGQILAIKEFIKDHCGVRIFRDNIRVYNYGEPFDDWLGLDLDKIQRAGDHFGKKVTIGAIELDLDSSNEGLVEKTNREGFIENDNYIKFRLLSKHIFNFFESTTSNDRDLIEEYIEGTKPIKKIGFKESIIQLSDKLKDKNLESEFLPLLTKIDKDYTVMRDIMVNSGLTGLNLGIAFHEVDREVRLINSELTNEGENINIHTLKDKISNLVQILESLSPILKQNKSDNTTAKKIIEITKRRNINRFNYHNTIFSSPLLTGENEDISFKIPTNLIIASISNLIDNSLYWTKAKKDLNDNSKAEYQPAIYIGTDLHTFDGPAIIIADNGLGFSVEPEFMIQPFKTKKSGGMGLGLYFADVVMNMVGGKIIFPDSMDLEIPSAYDGACIALVFPK